MLSPHFTYMHCSTGMHTHTHDTHKIEINTLLKREYLSCKNLPYDLQVHDFFNQLSSRFLEKVNLICTFRSPQPTTFGQIRLSHREA